MAVIRSTLNPRSAEFAANRAAMEAITADLHGRILQVMEGGPPHARERHHRSAWP
jgi:3-methylcrotonyl-CoA carboxylase beta subunit